jgi:hypothetical protein
MVMVMVMAMANNHNMTMLMIIIVAVVIERSIHSRDRGNLKIRPQATFEDGPLLLEL